MNNYDIIKIIGEGSFGKALLCKNLINNKIVVIKQINIKSQPENVKEASLREAIILEELNHPNIIQFYKSFFEDDYLCIEMEYAEGGDLYSKILNQKGELFSETQIITWLTQVCLALQTVHSHKILHRDIKTQNLFLDSSNNLKLGDFGIARCLNFTGEFASTVVGSPFYLSPEICKGIPYNSKTDVWSLGCVLYEICTLTPAFGGSFIGGVVMKILRSTQPPISGIYTNDLSILLDWMLQKEPGRRPSINQILSQTFLRSYLPQKINISLPPLKKFKKKKKQIFIKEPKIEIIKEEPVKIESFLMIKSLQKKSDENEINKNIILNRIPHYNYNKPKSKKISQKINLEPIIQPLSKKKSTPILILSDNEDELSQCIKLDENEIENYNKNNIEEIEQIREYLEKIIGSNNLIKIYNLIKNEEINEEEILNILKKNNLSLIVLIQRLILYDEQF